jgi:hypothetical protein
MIQAFTDFVETRRQKPHKQWITNEPKWLRAVDRANTLGLTPEVNTISRSIKDGFYNSALKLIAHMNITYRSQNVQ